MPLQVAGAQINLTVGDLDGNERRIAEAMDRASREGADVLVLPELAVSGYPPEDLVLRRDFVEANIAVLRRLARRSDRLVTVVGFVDFASGAGSRSADAEPRGVANAAAVLTRGRIEGIYHKVHLPNYGVFDEDRYFVAGSDPDRLWEMAGVPVGVSICEDIWLDDGPPISQARAGAEVLLNINASPFHRGKAAEREAMLAARARAGHASVVYLNLFGGQDELVFDGASVVIAADGTVLHRSPQFAEDFFVVEVPTRGERAPIAAVAPHLERTEEVYRALCTGLRDYCAKNGFDRVVIGLSGGIDSALTATIASDALGPDSVWGVSMPSRFSSTHSIEDAAALAANLGIRFDQIGIDGVFSAQLDALADVFDGSPFGLAEENLQARARGAILMAISNKHGPLVLATGNKSEMAVGFATLYGDMVGGYAVLKDVLKGLVYDLARWRNKDGEVIPQNTIDKPPSAELRPDQRDSDSLPPYETLDAILERYVEGDMGVEEIVADGYDADTVLNVARMVDRAEYKRRQAAPGVKITTKAFGKDRRLPITNRYRPVLP
ncbi:MAG TPA: NAD+ synthase [Acidimicrobiia bacterium]|jgi:NAD+ synthase (glutamine-hydrolysing)|nr:NAD+ synthase [Acidimicrobiia bacterium]